MRSKKPKVDMLKRKIETPVIPAAHEVSLHVCELTQFLEKKKSSEALLCCGFVLDCILWFLILSLFHLHMWRRKQETHSRQSSTTTAQTATTAEFLAKGRPQLNRMRWWRCATHGQETVYTHMCLLWLFCICFFSLCTGFWCRAASVRPNTDVWQ